MMARRQRAAVKREAGRGLGKLTKTTLRYRS